jgi:hypothetical protein
VITKRSRRELARWESRIRPWATDAARSLALAIYLNTPQGVTPYGVGVGLEPDERPWIEIPARFLSEAPAAISPLANWTPPIRPWLVTSSRIVGRLGDGRLYGWRWRHLVGCRIGLDVGHEFVTLDATDGDPLTWTGPAVAPLAVAAVYELYGPVALLDHPGLVSLRTDPD